MPGPSIYTPEGTFTFMLTALALALIAAVVYLVIFTGATIPP